MSSYQANKNYIIQQLGSDYQEAGGYEIRYKCWFCEEQGLKFEDYKLYVNINKLVGWCHRCESKVSLKMDSLIARGSNTDVYEMLNKLLNLNELEENDDDSDYYLIPEHMPMPGFLAWDYLLSRGIKPDEMSYYGIRVSSAEDDNRFSGRIIIPNQIFSKNWTDVYVARTYIGHEVRYKNPPQNKTHNIVFNLHRIEDDCERIIINEGVINAMIAGKDSVATYGKYVSDSQLKQIIAKNPRNIYVSLDKDAHDVALKLCDRIVSLSNANVYLVEFPDERDASDLGREAYSKLLSSSRLYNKRLYSLENYVFNN